MFRKLIKEPLVHFLLAGFLLFVFYRSCGVDLDDDNTINIKQEQLLNMLQFQSKAFNEEVFGAKFYKMSKDEKQQLIDQYVRDEVLYKEAIQLGLNQKTILMHQKFKFQRIVY